MQNYQRIIPRDFYNESKLLKCIGLLSLNILDNSTPCKIEIEESGEAFNVVLLDDGYLTIINYPIKVKDLEILFKTTYNSKANYPLYAELNYVNYCVFDESGKFDSEFLELINIID